MENNTQRMWIIFPGHTQLFQDQITALCHRLHEYQRVNVFSEIFMIQNPGCAQILTYSW